jgi:subtilase family serine protease
LISKIVFLKEKYSNRVKNMDQGIISGVSPGSGKGNDSRKFLITIIIILAVALVGLGALYLYKTSNNSQEPTGTENNNATPSGQVSNVNTAPPTVETTPAASTTQTTPVVQEETKKADLYVKSYSFSEDPKMGTEFTVTIVIGNKGLAASAESYWEWWATSSKQGCKKKVGAISAGGASTVQCNYTYSSWSNYTTKAVVDSQNDVDESNESNNIATKQVTPLHGKPDLYITKYDFNHDPEMGEEFKVEITIKNKGETDAGDFKWEWWPTAFSSACDGDVDSLAAGESKDVTCKYTYGGWSTYETKAVVDPDDDVDEANEGNNTSTKTVIPIH